MPKNQDEWYVKGTFTLENGSEIYFEMPAVFNEDGVIQEQSTLDKLNNFIQYTEKMSKVQNGN